MKRVIVTGSLGYIGSVLVPYLEEQGFLCRCYDTGFFKDCALYPPTEQRVVLKDARELNRDDLKDADTVVHLASMSNDPLMSLPPETFYDPIRKYSLKIAEMCRDTGIKFIFASSCSVYGQAGGGISTEESAPNPQTPYSLNKLQVENDLREISDSSFTPVIFRFATAYGLSPRIRFDLVINMLCGIAAATGKIILNSDGKAWRPFIHVRDMCKAIRYAIEVESIPESPLILNAGDDRDNYRIIDIAEMVKDEVPEAEIVFMQKIKDTNTAGDLELVRDRKVQDGVDTRNYRVSFEKIKRALKGFECDWTVRKGIKEMAGFFREIKLTEERFRNIGFYRLQQMEYLLQNGYLTEELFWKDSKA